jgi:RNA polymerase sigma-70 factor (ECF subfamily)
MGASPGERQGRRDDQRFSGGGCNRPGPPVVSTVRNTGAAVGETPLDVDDYLGQARAGDPAAVRRLVEAAFPLVARVVRAHLPRGGPEDDWRQEVLVRMLVGLDRYRGDAPFEHWLARVAANACLDLLRAHRRRPELRWSDLPEAEAVALGAALAGHEESDPLAARELVGRLLETLPAADRLLIRMLDLEQLPVAEVARRLNRGQSWVKVRAFRLRRRLRGELERLGLGRPADAESR